MLDLQNFAYGWDYWFTDNGDVVELVELSPEYEGLNVITLKLHILVPKDISSDLSINFRIYISSNFTDSEIDLTDNYLSYTGLTAMVFTPEWVFPPVGFISSEADENILLNATLINSGNSMDNQLKVKFVLEEPANSGVSVALSVPTFGDEYFSSGQWASIPLDTNQLALIEILIMVPPEISIPSELKYFWVFQF